MWRDDAYLLTSKLHQAAIVRALEVVGEAAGKISKEFREAHPEIQWRQMVGMRNWLIHDYTHVDLDRVWEVVTMHVPDLIAWIEPLVRRLKTNSEPEEDQGEATRSNA